MNVPLKENVNSFNRDVLKNQGYVYTTNRQFSSIVANERLTQATRARIGAQTKSIIDIGCGDGLYTAQLKAAFPTITFVGVDAAAEAIACAQKNYPDIQFLAANVLDSASLPPGPFDIAILRGVLHHMSDPALAIRNLSSRAKKLIIIEPNGNNAILKVIEKASKYHRDHEERSFFPRTLMRWCRSAGCDIVSLDYVGFVPFFCPTFLAKLIFAVQPGLERLPVIKQLFSAVSVIEARSNRGKG